MSTQFIPLLDPNVKPIPTGGGLVYDNPALSTVDEDHPAGSGYGLIPVADSGSPMGSPLQVAGVPTTQPPASVQMQFAKPASSGPVPLYTNADLGTGMDRNPLYTRGNALTGSEYAGLRAGAFNSSSLPVTPGPVVSGNSGSYSTPPRDFTNPGSQPTFPGSSPTQPTSTEGQYLTTPGSSLRSSDPNDTSSLQPIPVIGGVGGGLDKVSSAPQLASDPLARAGLAALVGNGAVGSYSFDPLGAQITERTKEAQLAGVTPYIPQLDAKGNPTGAYVDPSGQVGSGPPTTGSDIRQQRNQNAFAASLAKLWEENAEKPEDLVGNGDYAQAYKRLVTAQVQSDPNFQKLAQKNGWDQNTQQQQLAQMVNDRILQAQQELRAKNANTVVQILGGGVPQPYKPGMISPGTTQ